MIVYPVTAHRNGDREKHSYLVGVYSTPELANDAAEHEEEDRGCKYCCEIVEAYMDEERPFDYFNIIKPLPVPKHLSHLAENPDE